MTEERFAALAAAWPEDLTGDQVGLLIALGGSLRTGRVEATFPADVPGHRLVRAPGSPNPVWVRFRIHRPADCPESQPTSGHRSSVRDCSCPGFDGILHTALWGRLLTEVTTALADPEAAAAAYDGTPAASREHGSWRWNGREYRLATVHYY